MRLVAAAGSEWSRWGAETGAGRLVGDAGRGLVHHVRSSVGRNYSPSYVITLVNERQAGTQAGQRACEAIENQELRMGLISRRTFLQGAAAAACAGLGSGAESLFGNPLGLPLGLQLYSVRDLLPKDYDGTLQNLGALGYREVEAAGFFDHSASEVKQAMGRAGLNCVGAHYSLAKLQPQLNAIIRFGKDLGLEFIICAAPMAKDAPTGSKAPLTLEDWRWNAEQFNRIGERMHTAGLLFGYHNHMHEFRAENGVLPYDELLRLTDPAYVKMELDCGWMVLGGQSPADYLSRYPERYYLLHVKDFKIVGAVNPAAPPPSTELGHGSIDYLPIFEAAKKARVKHAFVEQEEFDMAPLEALRVDAEYMRALKV
jgi:sugar phosphate isomerase/epimerase